MTGLPLVFVLLALPPQVHAGSGPFGIDHEWPRSATGIFDRGVQVSLEYGTIGVEAACGIWLGNQTALGAAFWKAIDSSAFAGIGAQVLKHVFSRARPRQGDNPDAWFQKQSDGSFPSGEVTEQASVVTPFILDFGLDHPWVLALEALPAYDAVARMKSQAHWPSDVIAGWLLGSAFGLWAKRRGGSKVRAIMPKVFSSGLGNLLRARLSGPRPPR